MGRLGNQMFQFSSTLGISKKNGFEAKFPIENCVNELPYGPIDFTTGKNSLTRCNLLDCFKIDPSYFIPRNQIRVLRVYQESKFSYDSSVEKIEDQTSLSGYFQTEKYFSHCKDLILSQFKFKDDYYNQSRSFLDSVKNFDSSKKVCSIHVRRGDYVMYPNHHPCCTVEYYQSAIEKINSVLAIDKFIVFSDDPEWCKSEFNDEKFIISNLISPYSELCCMSLCDNNIIANSSFSWWASWLNKNQNKIVICPKRWFGDLLQKDTSDISSEGWITI